MAVLFDEQGNFIPAQPVASESELPVKQEFAKPPAVAPTAPVDLGMPGWKLALAGAGADLNNMYQGAKEKLQLLFRPNGSAGDKVLQDVNQARAERQGINQQLFTNPEANFGRFGERAATAIAAPARLLPQMALGATEGMLPAPAGATTGAGSDVLGSGANALESGLAAGIMGPPLSLAGRGVGLARGDFGANADRMALDAAAKRMGVNLRVADLDPNSWYGQVERALPSAGRTVEEQAGQLGDALSGKLNVPSASGRSYEVRTVPGEQLRQAYMGARDNLYKADSDKWSALDNYVVQNKLPPPIPNKTFESAENIGNKFTKFETAKDGSPKYVENPIFDRIEEYDPEAADWLRGIAGSQKSWVQQGVPFQAMNQMRIAVGKAMGRATRDASVPNAPTEAKQAKSALGELYANLNGDVADWGNLNAKTGEAHNLLKDAIAFHRDRIVPDIQNNLIVNKASKGTFGMQPRGYQTAADLYRDVINRPELTDRVLPEMNPAGRDLVQTFRAASDARRALMPNPPPAPPMSLPTRAVGALAGLAARPMQSDLAKRALFANDAFRNSTLGRLGWGAAQYPEEALQEHANIGLGREQP